MPNEITDSLVDIKDIEGYESLSPQEKVARVLLRLAEVRTDVRLKICALIQILPQVEDLALEPIDEIVIQTLLQAAREDEVITLQVVRAIVATILTQNNFITEALENTTDRIPTAEDILRSRTPNNTRLYDAFFAWLRKKNLTQVSVANALSIPQSSLSRILRISSRAEKNSDLLKRIYEYFGVTEEGFYAVLDQ